MHVDKNKCAYGYMYVCIERLWHEIIWFTLWMCKILCRLYDTQQCFLRGPYIHIIHYPGPIVMCLSRDINVVVT